MTAVVYEGMRTPWGRADGATVLGDGIGRVSTSGHGGLKLDATRNALVHAAWRTESGWYEEDCDWAIVAVTFPALFEAAQVERSHRTLKRWYPDAYTTVFGVTVTPDESHILRQRVHEAAHHTSFLVRSAWSGRSPAAPTVPDGMVGVEATRASDGATARFLVPREEYLAFQRSTAHGMRFPVDEQRHARWDPEV